MIRIAQQVSRAIRILRGNRDESARASHLVVNKDQFVNNELLQIDQAEREKCSQSTFSERKIMKTAFKRVALVAAAALAIGGISAVSANAANYSETLTVSAASSSVASGATASVVVTDSFLTDAAPLTNNTTAYLISSPAGNAVLPVFSVTQPQSDANLAANSIVVAANQTSNYIGTPSSVVTALSTLSITPVVAGTYVIKLLSSNANVASLTWTVTVAALAPITAPASTITPIPTAITGAKAQTGLPVGSVAITASNGIAAPGVGSATPAVLSATVSGPGLVSFNTFVGAGRAVSQVASNVGTLQVYADGNAGVGTITISSGTTVLGTVTAVFYGTPVKYTVAVIKPVVAVSTLSVADAISVSAVDANGAAVPSAGFGASLSLTSDATGSVSSTLSAPDTTSTGCSVTVVCYNLTTGATAGTANLSFADATNSLSAAPVAVRVSGAVPTTITFTTDAAAYPAGGVGTLTITLSDAAGPVPAGAYAVLGGAVTSSLALVTGTLPAGPVAPATTSSITVDKAGTTTVTFNAPLSDGTATITATPAASTITVVPASFTVSSGSSDAANAATDAANEATDAANAATDAANAAADSADAATQAAQDAGDKADAALAAVTALSQQVTTLLAKVAALASTLAKITAAIAKLPKK